jgi:hypothetical protein
MTRDKNQVAPHTLAVLLAIALVVMYGLVPAQPELFGIGPRAGSMIAENAIGAAMLAMIVAIVGVGTRRIVTKREPVPIHPIVTVLVFAGGCYWLRDNSWIDAREGVEGTVSALFRIVWFVIVINIRRADMTLLKRGMYVVATVILMFFDQSRTYFLIALLVLLTDLGLVAIVPALIAALLVAAVRSSENRGFIYSMMFAIGGEGYLGSQGVFQVLTIGERGINFSIPAAQALFSPLTATVTLFAKRLGYSADMFDSSSYLGSYIRATTGDTYPPMGGFFILSEFIRAGWFGVICMALYMVIVLFLTKKLFDTIEFPIGSFIAILAIKNSPMTYWNLVISVFVISYAVHRIGDVLRSVRQSKRAVGVPPFSHGQT